MVVFGSIMLSNNSLISMISVLDKFLTYNDLNITLLFFGIFLIVVVKISEIRI